MNLGKACIIAAFGCMVIAGGLRLAQVMYHAEGDRRMDIDKLTVQETINLCMDHLKAGGSPDDLLMPVVAAGHTVPDSRQTDFFPPEE